MVITVNIVWHYVCGWNMLIFETLRGVFQLGCTIKYFILLIHSYGDWVNFCQSYIL
jgi:hypothetical protein